MSLHFPHYPYFHSDYWNDMVVLCVAPKHRPFNRIALIRNYKCYKTQEDRNAR